MNNIDLIRFCKENLLNIEDYEAYLNNLEKLDPRLYRPRRKGDNETRQESEISRPPF